MNYNFDEIINRNGTDSVKWDAVERRWGRNDLIPMWVADGLYICLQGMGRIHNQLA